MLFLAIFFTFFTSLSFIYEFFIYTSIYYHLLIKVIVILVLLYILYLKFKYIKYKEHKLSFLRFQKYKKYLTYEIEDQNHLDITISILLLYFIFFIYCILITRIKNVGKNLNLNLMLYKLQLMYNAVSFFELIINIILLLLCLFMYFMVLKYIVKYLKFHLLKLYLYFIVEDTWENLIRNFQMILLDYSYIVQNFIENYLKYDPNNLKPSQIFITKFYFIHLELLKYLCHRIILFSMIFYDLFFNNLILSHMFKILPYVFLYELWIKLYILFLGHHITYDVLIAKLLYKEVYVSDNDVHCIYIDDEIYERRTIKEILITYVKHDFIDKHYQPQNPITEAVVMFFNFWKKYTFDFLIGKFNKYNKIDIIFILLIVIFAWLSCVY